MTENPIEKMERALQRGKTVNAEMQPILHQLLDIMRENERLHHAITSLLAEDCKSCQECAVSKSEAWKHLEILSNKHLVQNDYRVGAPPITKEMLDDCKKLKELSAQNSDKPLHVINKNGCNICGTDVINCEAIKSLKSTKTPD